MWYVKDSQSKAAVKAVLISTAKTTHKIKLMNPIKLNECRIWEGNPIVQRLSSKYEAVDPNPAMQLVDN